MAYRVALLAEGVDRNLSAAREEVGMCVALLAEGVDRNIDCARRLKNLTGRPPRGGRG